MSRTRDVQQHIRRSQKLLKEYEQQYQLAQDPKEKARAQKEIAELRRQIRLYEKDLSELPGEVQFREHASQVEPKSNSQPADIAIEPAPSFALENSFVLSIGIAKYRNIQGLTKTTVDARDIHDLLLQSGYSSENCTLLLDERATKGAINHALDSLTRRATPDSTIILFFSGHGAQRIGGFEPGEYICPVETNLSDLRQTAVSNLELTTALRSISAARLLVFLDACHSGGVGEVSNVGARVVGGLSGTSYTTLLEGKGRVLMVSCQPDEVSWELPDMRNGLFTHYLLKGLRGDATRSDDFVRVFDLFEYIAKNVPAHKKQHPLFKGEMDQNWAVTHCVPGNILKQE